MKCAISIEVLNVRCEDRRNDDIGNLLSTV